MAADAAGRQLLERVAALADRFGRPDLADRVRTGVPAGVGSCHVLVVGEHQRGKSALVNALLGVPVCGVGATGATVVPTLVRYGDSPRAWLAGDAGQRWPVDLAAVPGHSRSGLGPGGEALSAVEVELPRDVLRAGLVLVDTPGVGGGLAARSAPAALRALSMADAALFVTDAAQELTEPEVELLAEVVGACPTAACVVTKTDLYPHWRRIVELDSGHLERAGLRMSVLPVSAPLRQLALASGDVALTAESGIPALARLLAGDVIAGRRWAQTRSRVAEAADAVRQLGDALAVQRAALVDPAAGKAQLTALRRARERAERAQGTGARWPQLLADEIRGLRRRASGDLTDRIRQLRQRMQARLDDEDPARTWDDLEPWLQHAVTRELADHHRFLLAQARAVASVVAVEIDPGYTDPADTDPAEQAQSPAQALPRPTVRPASSLELGMVAARGFSLSGSVIGTLIVATLHPGFLLTLPVTAALGAVFAVRSVTSARDAQVRAARAEAARILLGYLDQTHTDVARADDELLDTVFRNLRDRFAERAGAVLADARATLDAATAASAAATADASNAARELAAVQAGMDEAGRLQAAARAVLALPGADR